MIRLILVDDYELERTSLRTFLETQPEFVVAAEASNGEDALSQVQENLPDVALVDLGLPDAEAIETVRRLCLICPQCKVLAMLETLDEQQFLALAAIGAMGYITKQAAPDELLAAIRALALGEAYLQPALAFWLLQDYRRLLCQTGKVTGPECETEDMAPGMDLLSEREVQVLKLVAGGLSNGEIGQALEISPKTVARHRERIMSKLNIHSSTKLVRLAIRAGMIPP